VVPSTDAGIFGCTEEGMGAEIRTKPSAAEHVMAPGTELPPMGVGQAPDPGVRQLPPEEHEVSVPRDRPPGGELVGPQPRAQPARRPQRPRR